MTKMISKFFLISPGEQLNLTHDHLAHFVPGGILLFFRIETIVCGSGAYIWFMTQKSKPIPNS